ncbi:NAD(P)/FAD-dependent oxidoreductase, partial [Gemmatimonadota bacterium]
FKTPAESRTGGREISKRLQAFLDRFRVELVPGVVSGIRQEGGHLVVDMPGDVIGAGAVIVATGTRPVRLEVAGSEELQGEGLYYEVRELLESDPVPERVAVIGGGEAALDYSLSLAGAGARVTLLVRGGVLRAAQRLIDLVAADENISVRFGIAIGSLQRSEEGVHVTFSSGEEEEDSLCCEGVVAAIGREAATDHIPEELREGDTASIGTGWEGMYIVGDARLGALGQVGIAVGDGLEAAMAAVSLVKGREGL